MKIIVVGGGKVGSTLCEQLVAEGHDVVLIEQDEEAVSSMLETLDINAVVGNGISPENQKEAGVSSCDLFIACTPSDEQNILSCMVAKKLGAKQTIGRVRDPEYSNLFVSGELGLDLLANPENLAAQEISRIMAFPYAANVEDIGDGSTKIVEYKIPQGSKLAGIAMKEIIAEFNARVIISTVQRGGDVFVPQGDFVLGEGDKIYVTATTEDMYKLFRNAGVSVGRNKFVFIIGGSRVAFYLAQYLAHSFNVTIIEKDTKRCEALYETLNGRVKIINADGFNQRVLKNLAVETADVVAVLSDDDEDNILTAMFTTSIGKKTIVKVDKSEYVSMLENVGINSVISPKDLTANQIVRVVRSMRSGKGGVVCAVYRALSSGAEFVEFEVGKDFPYEDVPIKDIRLKKNTLIVSIAHNGKIIVPNGGNSIRRGDHIVVVTLQGGLYSLNDIFA